MAARGALGPGEVIQAGTRLFGERWRDLLKIGAVAILPVTIAGIIAIAPFTPDVVGDIIANESTPAEIERRVEQVPVDEWIRWGVAYGIFVIASWLVPFSRFCREIEERRRRCRRFLNNPLPGWRSRLPRGWGNSHLQAWREAEPCQQDGRVSDRG